MSKSELAASASAGAPSITTLLSAPNAAKFNSLSQYAASENILAAIQQVLDNQAAIAAQLDSLLKGQTIMAQDLTALQAAVTNETTVTASAVTLIQGIAAQLTAALAAGADPVALAAMATQLNASAAALAAAVTANTPAAPATS
jgi:hypothetical protein